jgi:deoxyribodipyrimidine photo-lyase
MPFMPRNLTGRPRAAAAALEPGCEFADPDLEAREEPCLAAKRRFGRALVWLRRDLRLDDNRALLAAAERAESIDLAFVFDPAILSGLPATDRRVEFLWKSVEALKKDLEAMGSSLFVLHGDPAEEIPRLALALGSQAVFCGRDCEPACQARDERVAAELSALPCEFEAVWDHLLIPPDATRAASGGHYSVFGAYFRAWERAGAERPDLLDPADSLPAFALLSQRGPLRSFSLEQLGFAPGGLDESLFAPGLEGARAAFDAFLPRLGAYAEARDLLGDAHGGSRLSPYLRFGLVSPRRLLAAARANASAGAAKWIKELAWRDFCAHLLWARPDLAEGAPFNRKARDSGRLFDLQALSRWQSGSTGVPLVDAGMRELAATGFMANRARMACASYLCKDLLHDWRLGEAWMASLLMDFELASNNANWQWCAGTGADAQPFFRIFNPVRQGRSFDPAGSYVARWVPELAKMPARWIHEPWAAPADVLFAAGVRLGVDYPEPIATPRAARERALAWSRGGFSSPT